MDTLAEHQGQAAKHQAAGSGPLANYYARNLSLDNERRQQSAAGAGGLASQQCQQSDNNSNELSANSLSNRTTDSQTMMHILKANIGTGVLAMPMAFRHVGLWPGLVLVPLIGAICIHCMNVLIASHNQLCDRFNYESLDYDQVAALGLACGPRWARRMAKWASGVVTVFLMFTQIGFCCVYTLFAVENLQLAMLNLFRLDYSISTYLLIVYPIIGLASCTSNLNHLARISTLANVLQSVGLALIFYDLFQFRTYDPRRLAPDAGAGAGGPGEGVAPGWAQVRVEQGVGEHSLAGLPLFFATAVYAFEGIGVVLPLIKEMHHPERISGPNGVLNTSMSLVALLYMAMGFFGYAKYGQHVASSITLNLPETTLNELVRLTFAIAVGLSYSLQFYVPWTIVWPLIDESLFYSYRPRVARDKLDILNRLSEANQWAWRDACSARAARHAHGGGVEMRAGDEHASTASTLATSYSGSLAGSAKARRLAAGWPGAPVGQYGAIQAQQGEGERARKPRNRLEDVMEQDSLAGSEPGVPEVEWRPPPRSMRGKRKLVRYTVILLTVSFTCKYTHTRARPG